VKRSGIVALVACVGMFVGITQAFQPDTKQIKKEAIKAVQPTKETKPVDAKPAAGAQPDPAAMQAAWEKAMAKNEHHERLKAFEGTWDAAIKTWMDPSQPPMESKGTMVSALIHDGRFVQHDYKGEFMGQAFTGSGTFGYNNVTQAYESTWCDNMSTAILFSTGKYDAPTKTFTSSGVFEMPGVGKVTQREVITVTDAEHHTMTMYHTMPGQPEAKVMEIAYTKAKPAAAASGSTLDTAAAEAKKKAQEAADKVKKSIPTGK